jgi:Tat protein secretion system quality control protein TatD with DNase activity
MLIDSHCHINDDRLIGEADNIVESFDQDGIECVICVGSDRKCS